MADKGTEMVELMTQKGMGKEMSALSSLLVMVYGERGNQGSRGESWRSRPKRGLLFSFFLFRSRSHDIILNSNLSGLHSYPFISFSVMCGRLVMPSLKPVVI